MRIVNAIKNYSLTMALCYSKVINIVSVEIDYSISCHLSHNIWDRLSLTYLFADRQSIKSKMMVRIIWIYHVTEKNS